ncbi:hypothetical protein [Frisingicoccus sp.]|uniref:hypothetical protein n=1 Tax=Frisingicoccus sp. TaxID=1918627 RepID=UPI003AB1C049
MAFVDNLRNLSVSDSQRITATCNKYVQWIVDIIHDTTYVVARSSGKNRIKGYLAPHSAIETTRDSLGYGRLDNADPINFRWVYSDLNCTGFNVNDTLSLTESVFNERVLKTVRNKIIADGFYIHTLRCDAIDMYKTEMVYGFLPFMDKSKKIYTGEKGLFLYVELSW